MAAQDIAKRNKNSKRLRERKEETVPKKVKDKKVKLDMEAERESPKEEVVLLLDRKTRSREKIKQSFVQLDGICEVDDNEQLKTTRTKSPFSSKSNGAKPRASLSESRMYPQMSKEAIEESCPYCQGNYNCKACLRRGRRTDVNAVSICEMDMRFLHFMFSLISSIVPFLEQFNHEQQLEMEMEAKIKGLLLSDVEVDQIVCSKDERIYCNNCKTSIIDFHRSCPNCSYDLCPTSCREMSGNFLPWGVVDQCIDVSNAHSHSGEPLDLHS
ncbi:hypothetical protein VNO80_30522 [Phaseolus coccineus]|uniref:Uncharacterized protein n=1 Tax=Phaseolus coccineus TaxID=3886 RepID=A0AAN9LCW4_PHACN